MRNLFVIFMLGISGMMYSQTETQPFAISISTEKSEVKIGDPVDLNVVMTNISDHEVDCTTMSSNGVDRNYRYDVSFEDGQHLPNIEKKYHGGSSAWPCVIDPGKSDTPTGGRISRLFDFSRPGKYTIQVSRPVWGDDQRPGTATTFHNNQPEVKSDIITIIVLPADEPPLAK